MSAIDSYGQTETPPTPPRAATDEARAALWAQIIGTAKHLRKRDAPQPPRQSPVLQLKQGALATSGDSRRFVLRDGVRYGHVLNPKTGWPVMHAPRSVTVAASSCTEAGLLATLAILHGAKAREFLNEQAVRHWVLD